MHGARIGVLHVAVQFVPDQVVHSVARGEAGEHLLPVLPGELGQIAGDACIERSVAPAARM